MGLSKNERGQIVRNNDVDLNKNDFFKYEDEQDVDFNYGNQMSQGYKGAGQTKAPVKKALGVGQNKVTSVVDARRGLGVTLQKKVVDESIGNNQSNLKPTSGLSGRGGASNYRRKF